MGRTHASKIKDTLAGNQKGSFDGESSGKASRFLRDSGDLVARARGLYLEQRWDSRTHKQAVSVVCETLDLKRRRVNEWAAKFGWEGDV